MYAFPTRKISETLLDYAQPLVAIVGSHANEEQLQRGFLLAVTVWNAFVLDRARGGSAWQDRLRAQLGEQWMSLPVLRELVGRTFSLRTGPRLPAPRLWQAGGTRPSGIARGPRAT